MKSNHVEFIRQLLIKTILPLRKRKKQILSNFHLSIEFRISLNFLKLLVLYGFIFFTLFSFLFLNEARHSYKDVAYEMLNELSPNDVHNELVLTTYKKFGIQTKVINLTIDKEEFNNVEKDISENKVFSYNMLFEYVDGQPVLYLGETRTVDLGEETYEIYLQYDLSNEYEKLNRLLWKILLLYIVVILLVIRYGRKENEKLFDPIDDMTKTANRLTVNNLNSERINVEGTKNELKNLATVINGMLDRIETSYESQKQFVSDASHELRTPIAVIQGYANLLHRWGSKNEEVLQESIDAITNEAKSMQDLVEKLLFLSRHDKKTLKLDKKRFSMDMVVAELVKETKLVVKNRNINNSIMEPVTVYGDQQALKQAIRVFLDNAVKYTKDGDDITISCENQDGDCVITVADTGIGMTKKDMDNIFQRFYRSETVRNQNISGHGLGLSIAKLIILGHTGKIKIRSQYTKGTSFIITIPDRSW